MSFDVHTFSIVSSEHMERVQQIIIAMSCYINRTGVRLHDVYKLNSNTERKVKITDLYLCQFKFKTGGLTLLHKKPMLTSFFVAVEYSWKQHCESTFYKKNIKSPDNHNTL